MAITDTPLDALNKYIGYINSPEYKASQTAGLLDQFKLQQSQTAENAAKFNLRGGEAAAPLAALQKTQNEQLANVNAGINKESLGLGLEAAKLQSDLLANQTAAQTALEDRAFNAYNTLLQNYNQYGGTKPTYNDILGSLKAGKGYGDLTGGSGSTADEAGTKGYNARLTNTYGSAIAAVHQAAESISDALNNSYYDTTDPAYQQITKAIDLIGLQEAGGNVSEAELKDALNLIYTVNANPKAYFDQFNQQGTQKWTGAGNTLGFGSSWNSNDVAKERANWWDKHVGKIQGLRAY